ncbi:SSI family serine proteinase inhibitor [Streptomyces sp. NBC_01216]|uniref:SSI family serine proteinase inhibitor n=1 Tax=unclassified Streptomyces TaxID=2593676 RepID=UPI002E103BC1|nr:subtilase-type protease inhibitor [Streptomyces sp. NBC_01216]
MLRRLLLTTVATLATATVAATATAGAVEAPVLGPLPPLPLLAPADSLTVTITKSGHPKADGTFRLECGGQPGGTHPAAADACRRLSQIAREGTDPFQPVGKDRICTQQYGGPALAHVTGKWQGRSVDARFSRADGCEIDRWENLEPVLPIVRR